MTTNGSTRSMRSRGFESSAGERARTGEAA